MEGEASPAVGTTLAVDASAAPLSTEAPLSEDERLEYAEIGALYRHDDTMVYTAAQVFLPLSFGALAVAAQFPATRVWAAFFSISLYAFWLELATRCSWYTEVRLSRARTLERKAGLKHHLDIETPPQDLSRKRGARISIRAIRVSFFVLLILGWVGVFAGA